VGRRLGQHFLAKKSILDRIAEAACAGRAPLVIEIGPGKGALTESLLERADEVIAIELDAFFVHYLQQRFREPIEEGRLTLIEGDVLKTDLTQWGAPGELVIAGNLPYYITSPILEKVFGLGHASPARAASNQSEPDQLWTRAVFMMQAEVAARLTAQPGSRRFCSRYRALPFDRLPKSTARW
jgi:16S rRNA (adenine1518-N6/adenine1519-N6)-dimethyltransferase